MFGTKLVEGGYAISHQGFVRIIKRSESMVETEPVETDVTRGEAGGGATCKPVPGAGGYAPTRTKILSDEKGEYLQWGRAKHNPKWRPWNGEPVPYRLMSPDFWPE